MQIRRIMGVSRPEVQIPRCFIADTAALNFTHKQPRSRRPLLDTRISKRFEGHSRLLAGTTMGLDRAPAPEVLNRRGRVTRSALDRKIPSLEL